MKFLLLLKYRLRLIAGGERESGARGSNSAVAGAFGVKRRNEIMPSSKKLAA